MSINSIIKKKGERKTLFKYSALSIISMWVFCLYTMVDGMFVGRGVGPEALAAVNLSMPFINLTFALSIMTSIGTSTVIGKSLGAGDKNKSREVFTKTIIFVIVTGITLSVLGTIFRSQLAFFLGARGDMILPVTEYLGTIILFNTFYLIAYCLEVLTRVAGKPKLALFSVLTAAFTNILLDYLLVIIFPLGIKGAAIATGSAQLVQMIILLPFFMKKDSVLNFVPVKFNLREVLNIIKIGLPDSVTELSVGIVIFLFNRAILSHFGSTGLVSFGVISYINYFVLMTMIGLTQGMQPIASYLEGAYSTKKRDDIFILTLKSSVVIGLLISILTVIFREKIVSMFIKDIDISIQTQRYLVLFASSFIICGFNIVTSGFLTSMEETKKAIFIALTRGVILVSAALGVLPQILGKDILWITPVITEAATIVLSIYLFKGFRRKNHRTQSELSKI